MHTQRPRGESGTQQSGKRVVVVLGHRLARQAGRLGCDDGERDEGAKRTGGTVAVGGLRRLDEDGPGETVCVKHEEAKTSSRRHLDYERYLDSGRPSRGCPPAAREREVDQSVNNSTHCMAASATPDPTGDVRSPTPAEERGCFSDGAWVAFQRAQSSPWSC